MQPFDDAEPLSRSDLAVLQAIETLTHDGYCDATQQEIAEAAGLSYRHAKRVIRNLRRRELITSTRRYNRSRRKPVNRYQSYPHRRDSMSPFTRAPKGHDESLYPGVKGHDESLYPGVKGHDESLRSGLYAKIGAFKPDISDSLMHDSCMMHDDEISKELWITLDFLDEGERQKRIEQAHCTLDFGRAWRAWWDRRDFGALYNPAGWANIEMSRGHQPPLQLSLPEASVTFTGRGKTRAEAEAEHRLKRSLDDDARLDDDGFIR